MTETLIPFEPKPFEKKKIEKQESVEQKPEQKKEKNDKTDDLPTLRPTNIDRKIYASFVNVCKLKGCNIRQELERCLQNYIDDFKK